MKPHEQDFIETIQVSKCPLRLPPLLFLSLRSERRPLTVKPEGGSTAGPAAAPRDRQASRQRAGAIDSTSKAEGSLSRLIRRRVEHPGGLRRVFPNDPSQHEG